MTRLRTLSAIVLLGICSGCANVPPKTLGVDRFDYGQELAESWKRQTLINVVRLRYADAPVFMDVTSIISSRSRSGKVSAGGELWENPEPSLIAGFGAEGSWSNTPTVTYQPILGDKFAKSLLRPIPPSSVFQMLEAGWPAQLVLAVTVSSMNGINNSAFAEQPIDPRFAELSEKLARLLSSRLLGIRVVEKEDGDAVVLLFRGDTDEAAKADMRRAGEILNLEAGVTELAVTFGSVQINRKGIAMSTRSMLEIMLVLGNGIDVPESHVMSGRARGVPANIDPLVHINFGDAAPADAYAAVQYRGSWYWIDDTDRKSKAIFSFLMMLFSLAESGQAAGGPVVTVPSR